MKMTTKTGKPAVHYDGLQQRMIEEAMRMHGHANHQCGAECDPPTESTVLAFYNSLSESDRLTVDFLSHLHHNGYVMLLENWRVPPIEAMPATGQKH